MSDFSEKQYNYYVLNVFFYRCLKYLWFIRFMILGLINLSTVCLLILKWQFYSKNINPLFLHSLLLILPPQSHPSVKSYLVLTFILWWKHVMLDGTLYCTPININHWQVQSLRLSECSWAVLMALCAGLHT